MRVMKKMVVLLIAVFPIRLAVAQQLAFPGAEGFGKYTTGGRGGAVIEVTNLNDDGPGSLRAAIRQSGARTIVFRVSGTIYLQSRLSVSNGNLTIAGQTAPGDGITLANYNFNINASNVIIRYIRGRLGDKANQEDDAMTCRNKQNIIVDHCTFSWGIDEVASCYDNSYFTMQWCIVSESLYHSIHVKGDHGYGGIWGGSRVSFHHNLLAHHTSRNPRFNGAREHILPYEELVDHRNNVIYNWGFNSAYGGEPSNIDGSKAKYNIVGNYYKYGPGTDSGSKYYRILNPSADATYGYSQWYIDSNYVYGYPDVTADNWTLGVQGPSAAQKTVMRSMTPFESDTLEHQTAEEAYASILENAGAILPRRDTVDKRIVMEVENGVATYGGAAWGAKSGIIDSQSDVGGFPTLYSAPALSDRDHDGMPDWWEEDNLLNPDDQSDRNGDMWGEGYTNLEYYLNSITAYHDFLYPPDSLKAELTDVNQITLSWKDRAYNEEGYCIERQENAGEFYLIDTIPENSVAFTDTGLNYSTQFTYRVRAISLSDSSLYSNTATATTLDENATPLKAFNPQPENASIHINTDVRLSWDNGLGTQLQTLYLGTSDPPDSVATQEGSFYDLSDLQKGTIYYWRVDESNFNGTTTGDMWTFTTRPVLSDQLTGHWHFDTPPLADDSTIYGNDGQPVNMTLNDFVSGIIGGAVRFNGTDQYIRIPNSWVWDFNTESFTISCWIKQDPALTDPEKEYRYIVKGSNIQDSVSGRTGKRYELYYKPSASTFRFDVDDNVVKSSAEAGYSHFITNEWVHVVAIRDTASDSLKLYCNNVLIGISKDSTGGISQNEDMYFGYSVDYGSFYNGLLDDVRIYNYALSEQEIAALYHRVVPVHIDHIELNTSTSDRIFIFPVPASDRLTIAAPPEPLQNIHIRITDLTGKVFLQEKIEGNAFSAGKIELDISHLEAGTYIVHMQSSGTIKVNKLIVANK